jgi:RNA polymerase sigma-70 factor (ECF subfamily)
MPHDDFRPEKDEFTKNLIRRKARQIVGRAGVRPQDRDDLEQELWLHVWKRLPSYDPTRGHRNAFIATIIERYTANLLRNQHARWRLRRGDISLHLLVDGGDDGPLELAATLGQGTAVRHRGLLPRTKEQLAELAMDIAELLEALPAPQKDLAERLMNDVVAQVARDLGKARTSLYALVGQLREHLKAASVHEYLETLSSHRARSG